MKKSSKIAFLTLTFSSFILTVNAQTERQRLQIARNYDLIKLKELEIQFSDNYSKDHATALEMARQNNWPVEFTKQDGSTGELQRVDAKGNPIYYFTHNFGSAVTSRANTLYPGGSLNLNLTGTNMLAGVWDQYLAYEDHLDLTGRVSNFDRNTGGSGQGKSESGHGTHVTGTIISSGEHTNSHLGRGVAYQASVWGSNWENDLAEMTKAAAQGLLLSNHSYGASGIYQSNLYIYGTYDTYSKDLDNITFNAPYYQPVIAAGNDRDDSYQLNNPKKGGYDLLNEFGTSKNTIVVAAVYDVPNYTDAGTVSMSSFSSYGPTDDNRIKPDISDKGVNVYSTLNTGTTAYKYMDGTSMAAPGVVGTLLLLQQHYSNLYQDLKTPYMKAATLRGLACHTADETGDFDGPDSRFGWGLINAEKAAQTITNSTTGQSTIAELNLGQGQTYTKNIHASGSEPLMVTLVWTDRAGVANKDIVDLPTPVLVNDLDIRVTKVGGDTYFPWKLDDIANGFDAAAIKGDNTVDNIEKVQVDSPSGDYIITVTNKRTLTGASQDFSLIITGAGMNLRTNESDFKAFNVWPNPGTDILNIALQSDSDKDTYVALYDIQGKKVLDQKLELADNFIGGKLNVNALNQGMYLVKITQGDKQISKKILID